jgi:hypothetical protein
LFLVTATYLIEFSYRHQNYTKLNKQNSGYSERYDQKYKNLRFGKPVNWASYAECYKCGLRKCQSLSEIKQYKDQCQQNYDSNKNDAYDSVFQRNVINLYFLVINLIRMSIVQMNGINGVHLVLFQQF